MDVKYLAKQVLRRGCGLQTQHAIRRAYSLYQIRHNRYYREPEMAVMRTLVCNGDVVFDIGANVGVYTYELATAVGPSGEVHSFEPVAENYDILTRLIRKARLGNVSAHQLAIGATASECEIVIPDMGGFTGYYWAHLRKSSEVGRTESVKVRTIDNLCCARVARYPDFIKCDVEGSELTVILGSQETIRSHRPGWLIEVSRETSDQVFRVLHGFGYRAFVLKKRFHETDTYLDQEFSNYFFLHPDSRCWQDAQSQ
jgi:FkbM family methyltransferase